MAGLLGAAGGMALEAVEFQRAIHRVGATPWDRKRRGLWNRSEEPSLSALMASVVIRVFVGALITGAAAGSGGLSGYATAVFLGASAPVLIFEKAGSAVRGAALAARMPVRKQRRPRASGASSTLKNTLQTDSEQ